MKKKTLSGLLTLIFLAGLTVLAIAPRIVDRQQNPNLSPGRLAVDDAAREFHDSLVIMDWHADTLLWNRDIFGRHERGHVDIPRLEDGNVALQMFTVVSKVPKGQNYVRTEDKNDLIAPLAVIQLWPTGTWTSTKARAVYQAEKLNRFVHLSWRKLRWVRNRGELRVLLEDRERAREAGQQPPVGALLGMEGAHPLEGDIANLDEFYELGYRMIGPTHFFDNELAGSLHGVEKGGLTELGRQFVRRANELGIIIDIAHASEKSVREVLALSERPVVLSHGGMKGVCNSPRNLPDDLMKQVTEKGGLVAIGLWSGAICDATPEGIARSIVYAVETLGADHVALGSDWDGGVGAIDADDIAAITAALLEAGMPREDIAKVMGGNSIAFLQQWLP